MDPLKGDRKLETSWDIVHRTGAKELEEYLEEHKQIKALQKCALAQNVINKAKESSTR